MAIGALTGRNRRVSRLAGAVAASLFVFGGEAHASVVAMNFDGLTNAEFVNEAFNGGTGSLGSAGPNYGVSFKNAQVLDDTLNPQGQLATPPNSISFVKYTLGLMNVAAGFEGGLAFNYSAPYGDHLAHVSIWDGLNGTGNLLAALILPVSPNGTYDPTCGDDVYCPAVPFGTAFSGLAKSVSFEADYAIYDDITLGALRPVIGAPVPEPGTWLLMITGFAGVGAGLRRQRSSSGVAA